VIGKSLAKLAKGKKIVLVSKDGVTARLATRDVQAQTDASVAVLAGGLDAWTAAGKATVESEEPVDADAIDYLFWAHDRHQGNQTAMNTYLDWETDLPRQIEADGDTNFWSKPA
jgi:3-mercaptopyruvate sulfurtransferase SseA